MRLLFVGLLAGTIATSAVAQNSAKCDVNACAAYGKQFAQNYTNAIDACTGKFDAFPQWKKAREKWCDAIAPKPSTKTKF